MKHCIKPFILLVFLAAFKTVNAADKINVHRCIIKILPLAFVDQFSFPAAQFGFEYRFHPALAADVTYGQIFPFSGSENPSGFKSKAEIKYYISHQKIKKVYQYVGIEGFLNQVDYNSNGYFTNAQTIFSYVEYFRLHKTVWGVNAKYGLSKVPWKHFVFEPYAGLGVRIRDVISTRSRPEDSYVPTHFGYIGTRDQPDNEPIFNFSIGIKFGFAFL